MSNTDLAHLLPDVVDYSDYWSTFHTRPTEQWLPVLDRICRIHDLPPGEWTRFELGKNAVFGSSELVLKLGPPFWADDLRGEAETLRLVHGRLPVATPAVLATGTLGAWAYLLQQRLPGEPLRYSWPGLDAETRAELTYRQGRIMAALHALPIGGTPPQLAFDWTAMLEEQRADCAAALRQAELPAPLLDDLDAYLEHVWPRLLNNRERVLLHGDLDAINLLVEQQGSTLSFSGLVDWGDAKLGPRRHELISPGVHTLIGDRPALEAWYRGYGLDLANDGATIEHDVMARSLLYYGAEFKEYLARVPGASECSGWSGVAALLWQLSNR